MLVELCVANYAMYDGLVNAIYGIFNALTTYCDKTIIWIMFQSCKIWNIDKRKIVIITTTLNQNWH